MFSVAIPLRAMGRVSGEQPPLGAPADLRGNIHGNQVRCDRVNDWLAANAVT